MYVTERYATASSGDYTEGVNQDLTITYAAAGMGRHHVISGVTANFNAVQLGAVPALTVRDGTAIVFRVYFVAGGVVTVYFDPPKQGTANTAMTVTLEAGGAGVRGVLNVLGHWVD